MHASNLKTSTYLALGDSMSIDQYTGVKGGGAVSQFHKWLGDSWVLEDRTADMCRMRYVPTEAQGNLITLTIGGNDLLADKQRYIDEGLDSFRDEHLAMLQAIRQANPDARLIVGNVYAPQTPLSDDLIQALNDANNAIAANAQLVDAQLADIGGSFRGHEQEYLCYDIEPSLKGATVIADLFKEAARKAEVVQVTTFSDAALAVLNSMHVDPKTTYAYEHLSGGFLWSDEFPSITTPEWKVVSHDYVYRWLIQFRRRITLGDDSIEALPLWQQVLNHAPNWPGLLPDRRSGRIVKRLRAAERLAERCYEKLAEDCADGESSG